MAMKAGRRGARRSGHSADSGPALSAQVGDEIVRFQEASKTVDQIAAAILRLDQQDLPCMTLLLFGGPATAQQLAGALRLPLKAIRDVVARLEMAGYARRSAVLGGPQIELTPHAREWIDRISGATEAPGHRDARGLLARRTLADRAGPSSARATCRSGTSLSFDTGSTSRPRRERAINVAACRRPLCGACSCSSRRTSIVRSTFLTSPLAPDSASITLDERSGPRQASTPRTFMEQRRIERARTLIGDTNQPLADIAAAAGFATQSHLTTAFRRATGFTPAAYRRGRRA